MLRVPLALVLASAGIAVVSGCSSSSGGKAANGVAPTPTTPTVALAAGLDPCVVGKWQSTKVRGRIVQDNTVHGVDHQINFTVTSGGDGQYAVIGPSGSVGLAYSAMNAMTGTGADGATYSVKTAGTVSGTLQTSNGQATFFISNPSSATETVTQNGKQIASFVGGATSQDSTYTCSPHTELDVTSAGVTTTWTPQS